MDRFLKFLQKIDRRLRDRIERVSLLIASGKTEDLDIQPLKGQEGHYRCRVGDVRILFFKHGNKNIIYDAEFRGRIYKKR